MKFAVGDRVKCISDDRGGVLLAKLGTVIYIEYESNYLIEFDKHMNLHSGDNRGKSGYCWWIASDDELILVKGAVKEAEIVDVELGAWGTRV